MKSNKRYYILLVMVAFTIACKKDKFKEPTGSIETKDYVYNVALKGFQPEATVGGKITTNIELNTVYYYIQRAGKQDSLLQIDFPKGGHEYSFAVTPDIWPNVDLKGVKGLRLLSVQDNNSSLEQVVKLTYFDPASPVLVNIPATLTPALTGTTSITGKATSETGISKVYFYDNSTGNFIAIDSLVAGGSKDFNIQYNYAYKEGAGQLKVAAVDIYGLRVEKSIQFINIPFKPVIAFALDTLRAALPDGVPAITGTLKTYSAISTVEAYMVTAGGETLHGVVTPVLENNTATEYNYTFTVTGFPYADNVTQCKLVAKDGTNSTNAGTVPVKILPYYRWNNLTMMAQGNTGNNSPNCFFVGTAATPTLSACEVVNDATTHDDVDFAIFCNSTPLLAFNNPANISASTLTTFKCNGVSWAPATPTASTLKKTLFRVLGTSVAETAVTAKYNANTITDLSDAFFTGVSAPSASAPNSSTYATGSLIYAKVTPAGGGTTKNILIKVQQVNIVAVPNQATSTITIDVLKEK